MIYYWELATGLFHFTLQVRIQQEVEIQRIPSVQESDREAAEENELLDCDTGVAQSNWLWIKSQTKS